jgi:isoleucyl-tRNA synthetase
MYKETLNLPKTSFPMRADAARREPERLAAWDRLDLYARIRAARLAAHADAFILHDGPPYANEHIHLGTALNKILKDFVVRSRSMLGFNTPFVPGWDCHGLPIEQKVDRELGTRKLAMSDLEVRAACRAYAERFVDVQRDEFRRLGGIGAWFEPYLTMSPRYEADIAAALGKVVEKGLLYRERKAIRWCWHCRTALAEAELEYASRRDPEITVAFPADDPAALRRSFGLSGREPAAFAIWTTTPWTIPSNLAIAVHPEAEYVLVETPRGALVAASALAEALLKASGTDGKVLGRANGAALIGQHYRHPLPAGWTARVPADADVYRIVAADYVTLDTGTGLVHTAPGHGEEDFRTGKVEKLPIVSPLEDGGHYTDEVPALAGVHVFAANPRVVAELTRAGALLAQGEGEHEYPHCWRCHKPVIFRATEQYFIALTPDAAPGAKVDLRQRALAEIDNAKWVPDWGKARIRGMVENRFEWCVSRQRRWGSPITVLLCASPECRAVWPGADDPAAVRAFFARIKEIFTREGADAWYARPVEDFVPAGLACPKCGGRTWEKERDILDVWFDSGASHLAVCDNGRFPGLTWPADLYLEAHDQYRGWFQSSLLVGVVTHDAAPYRAVLVHGHVLDAEGRKMSKSQGNAVSPMDMTARYGADVLRLWAASVDLREDMPFSEESMTRTAESYRKVRNTLRYLLSNLYDFVPERDEVAPKELLPLDAYFLRRGKQLAGRIAEAYQNYEFHAVYHQLNNFCAVDLSALYLDILKDRLYCSHPTAPERRSAQTVLYRLARMLATLTAPVLPFTADEAWEHLPGTDGASVHVGTFELLADVPEDRDADERFERLLKLRETANKQLELKRQRGEIGKSLEATLFLKGDRKSLAADLEACRATLEELCIVSQVADASEFTVDEVAEADMAQDAYPGLWIGVTKAEGKPCPRCWQIVARPTGHAGHPELCGRCLEVVLSLEKRQPR